MKKITRILFMFFSIHASAKCPWNLCVSVYNDGIQVAQYFKYDFNYVAVISAGDSVVVSGGASGGCNDYFLLMRNADTLMEASGNIFNFTFTLSDTGNYLLYYQNHTALFWNINFVIAYHTLSLETIPESSILQFYPSASSGMYNISHSSQLKQTIISDYAGRIVFETVSDYSELNLSQFSSGLYYYAITDEKNKVWRGKLIKN